MRQNEMGTPIRDYAIIPDFTPKQKNFANATTKSTVRP